MGKGINSLRPAFFIDMHNEFKTQFLSNVIIPQFVHFLKLPGGVDMHERKWWLGREESFLG